MTLDNMTALAGSFAGAYNDKDDEDRPCGFRRGADAGAGGIRLDFPEHGAGHPIFRTGLPGSAGCLNDL